MKELNLSVTTSGSADKDNSVILTAKFATHDEAVAFHDGLARLCRGASNNTVEPMFRNPLKLLTKGITS